MGPSTKGDLIRDRIAANAQRRFEIAEAMKAEAGVEGHDLTGQGDGGIAWIDRARILAPEGENRLQLATLAHECGHVFLHGAGTPGYLLPGHVQEMEAESYAHQAFAAHGMRMPRRITAWGRAYVGHWVANDRAAGIRIDPRAEAYANGDRSPYEPLRLIPRSWHQREARGDAAWRAAPTKLKTTTNPTLIEATFLLRRVYYGMLYGTIGGYVASASPAVRRWLSPLLDPPYYTMAAAGRRYLLALSAGLVLSIVLVMWRTMVRRPGAAGLGR